MPAPTSDEPGPPDRHGATPSDGETRLAEDAARAGGTTLAEEAAPAAEAALVAETEALARRLLADARHRRSWGERARARRIARLLADPEGLDFVLALTDEVLRIMEPRRAARRFHQVATTATPSFLGPLDALLLRAGAALAGRLPAVVMPLVRRRVAAELARFVVPAEPGPLARHLARRRSEGVRVNVNLLGEAVLGDAEARHHLGSVLTLLERPDVDYVSVKVSSVCAQLDIVAFDTEVDRVAARVRLLYEATLAQRPAKFVNLDMEEYRDLHLTVEVFRRLLDEDRFAGLEAGIVLQAYIPDSLPVLRDLVTWARRRHDRGGAAVKVRLVKGANLAMEKVEAELAGWPAAPFPTKAEVDANYKRMLDVALDPANLGALRVGVATHNLFEAAWALVLARHRGVGQMVEMEMLEGMAPALAEAVRREAGGLLLYTPIAGRADYRSVIAYLVRRFEENAGSENFLHHQFSLRAGSAAWRAESERFRAAVADRHHPPVPTNRVQDRRREERREAGTPAGFANEPDTDFSLVANREWLAAHLIPLSELGIEVVPAMVAGQVVGTVAVDQPSPGATPGQPPKPVGPPPPAVSPNMAIDPAGPPPPASPPGPAVELLDGYDPADPGQPSYQWVRSTRVVVDRAVAAAGEAAARWADTSAEARAGLLHAVAPGLAAERGRLIGIMARDGGKTVTEADPEVSEAVDTARWYAAGIDRIAALEAGGARFSPYGVVVVVPPWNFPLAIPAGGVCAALAAGNAVILKPAPETVATGWALAEICWRAGVPRDVVQFVPCADDDTASRLITHPGVGAVVLTGSWETARRFLGWRPALRLHAETSGKNAIVVTAAADVDQAVADLVRSAFGHAGQKCSAASLAIVEASVYDDPPFRSQLADAVRSLRPGAGYDVQTTIGPLIRPPEGPLAEALSHLDRGESWLVEPHQVGDNPQLWSPGVKLGVRPGSAFHLTECFGPVLGVMRAADLDQAVAWQNQPAYGLTAGLESLDPEEIARWRDTVEAGNLYVNRHITGAIVGRQPFGGWKRSVVGPGAKAGGPNYVASLGTWTTSVPAEPAVFGTQVAAVWEGELRPADRSGLGAEANVGRYVPLRSVLLRAGPASPDEEVALALAAAGALGVSVDLSGPAREDDATFAARLASTRADKVRFLGGVTDEVRLAAHDAGLWIDDLSVVADARIEVLRWVREQALSETRHRHGNPSPRHSWPEEP